MVPPICCPGVSLGGGLVGRPGEAPACGFKKDVRAHSLMALVLRLYRGGPDMRYGAAPGKNVHQSR